MTASFRPAQTACRGGLSRHVNAGSGSGFNAISGKSTHEESPAMLQRVTHSNGVVTYQSPLLAGAGVPHAFSTRLGGVSTGALASNHQQVATSRAAVAASSDCACVVSILA